MEGGGEIVPNAGPAPLTRVADYREARLASLSCDMASAHAKQEEKQRFAARWHAMMVMKQLMVT